MKKVNKNSFLLHHLIFFEKRVFIFTFFVLSQHFQRLGVPTTTSRPFTSPADIGKPEPSIVHPGSIGSPPSDLPDRVLRIIPNWAEKVRDIVP